MPETAGSAPAARLTAAVSAAAFVGFVGPTVMPLLVGGLIDSLGIGEAAAGAVLTVELAGGTLGALGLARRLGRESRRGWALAGATLAVLANAASLLAHDYAALLVTRSLVGLGSGACLAAGNAAAAAAPDAERLFARVALIVGLATGLLLVALPVAMAPFGVGGAFALLAGLCLVVTPVLVGLPRPGGHTGAAHASGTPHPLPGAIALVAVLLVSLAGNAVWSRSERIGLAAGLSAEGVGWVLGLATVAGLAGAAAAAWMGRRFGRQGPLQLALIASAVSMVFIVQSRSATPYVVNQVIWGVAFFLATPYLLGVAAALDAEGRWTAAASGASSAGTALGPLAGGLLAPLPVAFAAAVGSTTLAVAAVLYPVVRWIERGGARPG